MVYHGTVPDISPISIAAHGSTIPVKRQGLSCCGSLCVDHERDSKTGHIIELFRARKHFPKTLQALTLKMCLMKVEMEAFNNHIAIKEFRHFDYYILFLPKLLELIKMFEI